MTTKSQLMTATRCYRMLGNNAEVLVSTRNRKKETRATLVSWVDKYARICQKEIRAVAAYFMDITHCLSP